MTLQVMNKEIESRLLNLDFSTIPEFKGYVGMQKQNYDIRCFPVEIVNIVKDYTKNDQIKVLNYWDYNGYDVDNDDYDDKLCEEKVLHYGLNGQDLKPDN